MSVYILVELNLFCLALGLLFFRPRSVTQPCGRMKWPNKIKRRSEKHACNYMRKRFKVSRMFTTYPNGEVAGAADLHASKMENNPVFPAPPFKPADITTQNQTL